MAQVPVIYVCAWPLIVGAMIVEMIIPGTFSKPAERWVNKQEREAFKDSDLYKP
jgi:hypothetical protein